ncbi:MAG: hypothetical protein NZ922_00710 [Candidatus Methanomethyliaceae archaeon]|nr:hypothetical protein [Candidatus Methanomethyliaceae archaeon]MDW7970300.1 hypothetical protein [Nitrososphaerota archaeon]
MFFEAPPKRDIFLRLISDNKILVVSCDSSGAIGPKDGDLIKVAGEIVGKFMARSALMEVLASGAKPICISCGLSVEPLPTGYSIIKGVKEEMKIIGMDSEKDLLLSTEKNFPTNQTGLGITVIGVVDKEELRIGRSKRGDIIVSIGIPSVGMEVLRNEVADLRDLLCLLSMKFIHSIIPVGSKGIIYESKVLAAEAMLEVKFLDKIEIDIKKSAGPSTVLLATLEENKFEDLKEKINKPIHKIAILK